MEGPILLEVLNFCSTKKKQIKSLLLQTEAIINQRNFRPKNIYISSNNVDLSTIGISVVRPFFRFQHLMARKHRPWIGVKINKIVL